MDLVGPSNWSVQLFHATLAKSLHSMHQSLSFSKGRLSLKVVFHQRSFSFLGFSPKCSMAQLGPYIVRFICGDSHYIVHFKCMDSHYIVHFKCGDCPYV